MGVKGVVGVEQGLFKVCNAATSLAASLWIPAFAGITMALRRPHKRMKMAGRLVPVDSRFRGNDGVGLTSIFIAMTAGGYKPKAVTLQRPWELRRVHNRLLGTGLRKSRGNHAEKSRLPRGQS